MDVPTFIPSNENFIPNSDSMVKFQAPVTTKVYKRRLWMLFLFSFTSMLCGMMFPEYIVAANVTSCFYGVGTQAVNWTAMMYMVVYIILVFPMSSFINCIGLRWTVLCGAAFNTAASAVQFFTLHPGSFAYVMASTCLASLSNSFILGIPPVLAAKWFPTDELSRACAFGVFGNQLGVALGFILTPLLVSSDCSNKNLIGAGKMKVACILTAVNAVILILIAISFQNAPKVPPSVTEATKSTDSSESPIKVVLSMFKNTNFLLIFVLYGLMVGSYFAVSTILSDLILGFFPKHEVAIGWMGMLMIVSGLVGSLIAGYILDCTHRFKETTVGICIATLVTCVLFSCLLFLNELWVQFVTITLYGFFLTSFLPIGFEYGIEVTYPASENVCASLLNSSTMIFGMILTSGMSYLLNAKGPICSNIALSITYFICCIITCFVTKEYKRSKKGDNKETPVEIKISAA